MCRGGLAAGYAQQSVPGLSTPQLRGGRTLARAIDEQIGQPLREESIEELIRRSGYSSAHGLDLFCAVYGLSPQQYGSRLKLVHAKELLLDPMRQIGEMLSHTDPAHL